MKDFNLLGKDYFSQAEAAHYCCISTRHLRTIAAAENIWPIVFGGKLLYRRSDLQRVIEAKWQPLEKSTGLGCLTGGRQEHVAG